MTISPFVNIFDILSSFAAELEKPEIGISGKVLNKTHLRQTKILLTGNLVKGYSVF